MKRRLGSIILAWILCAGMILAPAGDISVLTVRAAEIVASGECGANGDNLTFTVDDEGVLTIEGIGAMAGSKTTAGRWGVGDSDIKRIVIKDGATTIGYKAFYKLTNVESAEIPESVTLIDQSAFEGDAGLTDITLPSSLKSISAYAFSGCKNLTSVRLPDGVTIGSYAFSELGLTEIVIPDNVTFVSHHAFSVCGNLTSVTIGSGTQYLEEGAFYFCHALSKVILSNTVRSIGADCFCDCPALKEITLPDSITSIGSDAFEFCSQDLVVYTSGKNTVITDYLKENNIRYIVTSPLEELIIDESLTLTEGEEAHLTYTAVPEGTEDEKTLAWSSTDETVATVDQEGNVTAVSFGECEIVLTAAGGLRAICKVTVNAPVTGMSLNESYVYLEAGETKQLAAVVEPESSAGRVKINWSSSDEYVAAVDENGLVTAAAAGTAVITASVGDAFSAYCEVEVWKDDTVYPTALTLDRTTAEMHPNGTLILKATFTPADSTYQNINWFSTNTSVATVDANGRVTAVSTGTASVFASSTDYPDLYDVCRITVTERQDIVDPQNLTDLTETITKYGKRSSNGYYYITFTDSNGYEFSITYQHEAGRLLFRAYFGDINSAAGQYIAEFDYVIDGQYLTGDHVSVSYIIKSHPVLSVFSDTPIDITAYKGNESLPAVIDTNLSVNYQNYGNSGDYQADWDGASSSAINAAMAGWNYLLVRKTRTSLREIGFLIYGDGEMEVWELEPNNTKDDATELKLAEPCSGELGSYVKYKEDGQDADYYVISLTAGKRYRITLDNYVRDFMSTSMLFHLFYPGGGTETNMLVYMKSRYQVNYYDFTATSTGDYHIRLYNYTDFDDRTAEHPYVIKVEEIPYKLTISKTSAQMDVNDTLQLSASITPKDTVGVTVKWSSDNTTVARVTSDGLVTARKEGTATITATTSDSRLTAKCVIRVGEPIRVEAVYIYPTTLTVAAGKTSTLKANIYPAAADNQNVTWKSSNTSIAKVDQNGKVTGVSQGTANITVTTEDGGYRSTCKVNVLFSDVTDSSKAVYKAVYDLAAKGIVKGYGSYFDVNGQCTRAQFVLFLWRLAGKPAPKSTNLKFGDAAEIKKLAPDYTNAIAWGNEKGIVMGYTSGANKGKFKPNDPCTRAQVVMFLWRYKGKPFPENAGLYFTDLDEIRKMAPDYFKAINWAADSGITIGYSDGSFKPNKNCTRGECVTFLYRMK